MARIPIDRDIKIMLLQWLKNDIDWQQLAILKRKYPLSEEEKKVSRERILTRLHQLGECAVIKEIGKCFPGLSAEYQRKHPHRDDT